MNASQQARDAGMDAVLQREEFKRSYDEYHDMLPNGLTGIAEVMHNAMRDLGIGEPPVPQAWGANFNRVLKRGGYVATGGYGQMENPEAHARSHCPIVRVQHEPRPWD